MMHALELVTGAVLIGGCVGLAIYTLSRLFRAMGLRFRTPHRDMRRAVVFCGGGALLAAILIAVIEIEQMGVAYLGLIGMGVTPCVVFGGFVLSRLQTLASALETTSPQRVQSLAALWISLCVGGWVMSAALSGVFMHLLKTAQL